jgi:glucose-1-phosphate thymidylyltransferase
MHAIIPVAGFGTRLRPHTYSRPKVLLNVAGKPILAHILDQLISAGVTSATIVVGYMGEAVEAFVRGAYPSLTVNFVEQKQPQGLGHAIWVARESIPSDGSPLFIMLGDTIFGVDLAPVFQLPTSALGVKEVEDPRRFGVAEVENNIITHLVEKPEHPKTNLAVVGLYFFRNPPLLKACLEELIDKNIRSRNEYQLTDALQMMIERGERFATFHVNEWYDCGKPETLLETNRHLLDSASLRKEKNSKDDQSHPQCIINPPVFIGEGAKLTNCVIGPYAAIGPRTIIDNAIIRDSIIGDGARIECVMLESSIVGNEAVIKNTFHHINIGDSSEVHS